MALIRAGYRGQYWVPASEEGSEYVPPAGMAFKLIERGLIEPVRDGEGQETGRYRLTDVGMRKARQY